MSDFRVLVETLVKGSPWAVMIAAIGVIWQLVYAYTRDKSNDREASLKRGLETEKFEYQKAIEDSKFKHQRDMEGLRFEYEQRRWREQLALQLVQKQVDARLAEYPELWYHVGAVANHNAETNSLTTESAKNISSAVENWRYSKGGLLAEETTREAAVAFQAALWEYDGSAGGFTRIRDARRLLRAALRADMGLGEDAQGHSIFHVTESRLKIIEELFILKASRYQ